MNLLSTQAVQIERKNIESSIKEACDLRFRPIMMTSISTMIAMMTISNSLQVNFCTQKTLQIIRQFAQI